MQNTGEITPDYSGLSLEKIAYVKKILPKAKIILLLRHPIDRAWSHAVMDLVTLPKKSFCEITDEEFIKHFTSSESMDKGCYPQIIKNWSRHFSKKQMFIENFSKITENPEELLQDIFSFLGVDAVDSFHNYPVKNKVLPNHRKDDTIPKISEKHYEYLHAMYKDDIKFLKLLNFHF